MWSNDYLPASARKHPSDLLTQRTRIERLLNEVHTPVDYALLGYDVRRISRHEQYLDAGAYAFYRIHHILPAHSGHDHIAQYDVNLGGSVFAKLDGLQGAYGFDHRVTYFFKH